MPEVDTAVRSLTVMWDGSLVVAANNHGTCYVWRLLRGTQVVSSYTQISNLTFGVSLINNKNKKSDFIFDVMFDLFITTVSL